MYVCNAGVNVFVYSLTNLLFTMPEAAKIRPPTPLFCSGLHRSAGKLSVGTAARLTSYRHGLQELVLLPVSRRFLYETLCANDGTHYGASCGRHEPSSDGYMVSIHPHSLVTR